MKTKVVTPKTKHLRIFLLGLIVALACATPVGATPGPSTPVPAAPHALGDPQELKEFFDGLMTQQLAEEHVAGAVVVVVQDGQVLLAKGYGYADVEQHIPVDAEQTLFKAASVSKLLTWTAVMQLVEQGKIDLQADVNTYLTDFQIPAKYQQPITVLDLMDHTAGFDLVFDTMFKSTPEELTSLGTYLAQHIPARIFPPSQVPAYSNFGATLAGHIVEQVSGESYEQYVEEHILKPLGMQHSSMRQLLPEHLASGLAQNYWFNGQYKPLPSVFCQFSPAGGLSASGADMGRFMLAHLQDGQYNGARILKPETARQMHAQSFTIDPLIPGIAHGFMEYSINGRRLIGHDGDYGGWRILLRLMPTEQVGIFAAYNTDDGGQARKDLLEAFMKRYFPGAPVPALQAPADFASRARRYTGNYFRSDRIYTKSPAKAFIAISQVRSGPNNTLLIDTSFTMGTDTWIEVRPLVVQNTRTGDLAVFSEDERGQVRSLALGNEPSIILIKMPWYGSRAVKNGVMGFSLLTFLATVIAATVALFVSLRKRVAAGRSPWLGRLARWVALVLCLLGIVFLVAMPVTELTQLDTTMVLTVLPWFVAVLAPAVVLLAAAAWWKRWWGLARRLHYTVIALAALALLWFQVYWGFLFI